MASMAPRSPRQSAWSETVNPWSKPRRRRGPRSVIQPEAKAVDTSPNFRIQGEPLADGGAITSPWPLISLATSTDAYLVGGSSISCSR